MEDHRNNGFQLGEWQAHPSRNLLVGSRGEVRLEPKAMQVLEVLASDPGRVFSRDELNDAVWDGRAVSDEPLTHCIAALRQALVDSPKDPQYIQTIPKRGYRLVCIVNHPPESTDSKDDDHFRQWLPVRGHLLPLVAALVLVLVLMFAGRFIVEDSPPEPDMEGTVVVERPLRSIAVLPFDEISEESDARYFSDGLTEEILNSISQLPELQVTGRTSSFYFRDKDVSLTEIADSLNVAYILEGSVRRNEDDIRITAQLIHTADGSLVWSRSYDRKLIDALQIQSDIAENVAESLGIMLDDEARQRMRAVRINDVQAFIAYQKGLEAFAKAHHATVTIADDLAAATAYFDEALEANPNLSAIRILRADRANHVLRDLIEGRRTEMYEGEAKDAALALQTELELAWQVTPRGNQRDILNVERTLVSDDWTGLSQLIQLAMRPGNCPRINVTESIEALGWAEELAAKLEESLACNPLDVDVVGRLARTLTVAGRPEEALELLDRLESLGVYDPIFSNRRFQAMLAAGRQDDPEMQSFWSRRDFKIRQVRHEVLQGNHAKALQMAEHYWASADIDLYDSTVLAMLVGDRLRANEFAARIDSYPGSALSLLGILRACALFASHVDRACQHGMPFDIDATPNFKARIEESGLIWPPAKAPKTPSDTS